MRKSIVSVMMFLIFMGLVQAGISLKASVNTNLDFTCYNASNGVPIGTAATLTCRDKNRNADINGVSMTNQATGVFNYTINLLEDTYSCSMDCSTSTAIDPRFFLEVRPDYFDDAGGDLVSLENDAITAAKIAADAITSSELAADAIGSSEIATDAVGAAEAGFLTDSTAFNGGDIAAILTDTATIDTPGEIATSVWNAATATYGGAGTYGQSVEDIFTDTDAQDTAAEWNALMDLSGETVGTCSAVTSVNGLGANVVTAASIATDAFTSDEFAATATAEISDAVFDEPLNTHDTENSFGDVVQGMNSSVKLTEGYVDTEVAAILDDTGTSGVVLANDAITAAKIATDAIGASEIGADSIGASELVMGETFGLIEQAVQGNATSVTVTAIGTDVITATSIQADAIGAAEIAADAINANEILTDAIGASELATDAVVEIATQVMSYMNLSHGTGLYNTSAASATISAADKNEIAKNASRLTTQNITADHGKGLYNTSGTGDTAAVIWSYATRDLTTPQDVNDTVVTLIEGIKTKTDNLPTDPADDSDIDAQLLAIDNYVDTEVADILADTATLPVDPADNSMILSAIDTNTSISTLSASDKNEIAYNSSRLTTRNITSDHGVGSYLDSASPVIVTLDLSSSGPVNHTYYYEELAHIVNGVPPENVDSFATNEFKKQYYDVGSNMANPLRGQLIFWLVKTGAPAGNLTVLLNGVQIREIDPALVSTSLQKWRVNFTSAVMNTQYYIISFNGQDAWAAGNRLDIGAGENVATNSYGSTDGVTYTHSNFEFSTALILEHNVTSVTDQLLAGGVATQENVTQIQNAIIIVDDYVDTEVAAIKAKTDNLPTDPADNSMVLSAIDTNASSVTVTSIGTDVITATSIAADAIGSSELASSAITSSEVAASFYSTSSWNNARTGLVANGVNSSTIGPDSITSSEWATSANDEVIDGVFDEIVNTHDIENSLGDIIQGMNDTIKTNLDLKISVVEQAVQGNASSVTVTSIGSGVITATSIATDAITSAEIATDAIGSAEIATSAIGTLEWAAEADNNGINLDDTSGTLSDAEVDQITVTTSILNDTVVTLIEGIKTKTDNLPTDPADDSDIDAQLLAIDNYVDTEVADILADTATLPTDPADQSMVEAAIEGNVTSPASIWTYVTRTLTAFSFNVGLIADAVNSSTLSTDAAQEIAVETDAQIAVSHGTGLYNSTAGTASDIWSYATRDLTSPQDLNDTVVTLIEGVKAKTDNLPTDPADNSMVLTAIAGNTTSINNNLYTPKEILNTTVNNTYDTKSLGFYVWEMYTYPVCGG